MRSSYPEHSPGPVFRNTPKSGVRFGALTMVRSEAEAEVICGMLRENGVRCGYQQTNIGAGAADGFTRGGALEIFVSAADAKRARKLLRQDHVGR